METVRSEMLDKPTVPLPSEFIDSMRTDQEFLKSIILQKEENSYSSDQSECSVHLDGGLVYQGSLKNGKMHGFGMLTWPNKTKYTGEFFENVFTGKGSYSWPDGSCYEGSVSQGLRHGYGTYKAHNKIFYGNWMEGKRHGKGLLYYDMSGQSYYDGNWVDNMQCGYALRRFKNGNIYKGNFKNNKRNGPGTMYWHSVSQEYTGDWLDGLPIGKGSYIWYLKRISNSQYLLRNHYVGEFVNGKRQGFGIFYYANGSIYEGDWMENIKHGYGKFTFKNGCVFQGDCIRFYLFWDGIHELRDHFDILFTV